ncbi:MAG: ABC transporter ATP-binding protein [Alphaproteobacteria bacterium]|nr:ABC transporter ATP-binding protein [Alphaproteobacteria bacterium]
MDRTAVSLGFRGVAKSYGAFTALHPLDLDVEAGEFLTLLGPSGSGKTTLLNIAAGFLTPDAGSLFIGGSDMTQTPARKRNAGMVFQSYALFPHLSVFENVAYGLRVRRVGEAEIRRRVEAALALVQLDGMGGRKIQQLSGGQGQRVALARALVIEPDVLLMDEPLGALDRQLRKHVQLEIRRLHREIGRTTLYVTHDQEEALVMSDRIGIMSGGRLAQIGTPRELYERPANAFVARFLGESNLLEGRVAARDGDWAVIDLPELGLSLHGIAETGIAVGDKAAALLRPEIIELGGAGTDGVAARVAEIVYLGELISIRLALPNGQELWCRHMATRFWPEEGATTNAGWRPEDVRVLPR